MDSNSSSSLQPTSLKLDDETHRLWGILLAARQDHKNLSLMSGYLDCLCGRFDG
jgi:hypothetical protein